MEKVTTNHIIKNIKHGRGGNPGSVYLFYYVNTIPAGAPEN